MKLSGKIGIYMTGVLLLGGIALLTQGHALLPVRVVWVLYVLAGMAKALYWAGSLERAVEKLPDIEAFCRETASCGDATVRKLTEGMIRMDAKTRERYSARVMDRQSRLNALQSQINPHFLYNTLECIRSEAMLLANESIANMAKSLASFFRYSISRKENMVTILDEIGNIRNYFMIQNYRFENKFRFELEAEEEERVYRYLIPKMTIQPIVENSIFHGLETKAGDCIVKIQIAATEDKVILMISDNGIGMSAQALEKLRLGLEDKREENSAIHSAHGNGIALYNVNQRIKLSFGAGYGLQIYSTEGVGTDVEMIMPIVLHQEQLKGEEPIG